MAPQHPSQSQVTEENERLAAMNQALAARVAVQPKNTTKAYALPQREWKVCHPCPKQ
jgi:hypothetical protein